MDLDGFKKVNDTYGHLAGDELLKKVSEKLLEHVRSTDIVARMGGDEFAVFLNDISDISQVEAKALELCKVIEEICELGDHEKVDISASIGIAIAPRHGTTFGELYKKSDTALYVAKRTGKNRSYLYNEDEQL